MSAQHPAARIAAKFPTSPCILRMKENTVSRPTGRVALGSSVVQVVSIWDKRPGIPQIVATIFHNGEVRELVRNTIGEDNPNTTPDPFTLSILDNSEIELVPSSGYVEQFVRNVINDVKDGLVDRSAAAIRTAGEARALADSLAERITALPATAEFNALRADMLGVRAIAESAEHKAQAVVVAAEERIAARERVLQERFDAQGSQMAALERKVAALEKVIQAMLAASEAPAPKAAEPAEPAKPAEPADPVAVYTKKLDKLNYGQLKGEFKSVGMGQPATGTSMAEMRELLIKAFVERQHSA